MSKLIKFRHGKPCKKCGNTLKYVTSRSCVTCALSRKVDKELKKEYSKKWYIKNRDKRLKQTREYSLNNPDVVKLSQKKYQQRNKPKLAEKQARRRSSKSLLAQMYKKDCIPIYNLAKDCQITSGEKYHVDHIVPLNGKNICGLHVPWNLQVLPSDINERKSNHYGGNSW